MKYKIGDKVVIKDKKDLEDSVSLGKYAHQICTIVDIYDDLYKVEFEEGDYKYILEERIDHKVTLKINGMITEDTIASYEYATKELVKNIEEMKNSNPTIKVKIGDKIIYSKGGETMNANEILEKWRNKKADELISQQDEEIKKVKKEDEIQKLVEEHETEINKIIKDKYKIDTQVSKIFCTITTRKTKDKIEAINKEFDKKVAELDEKEEEIKAVLKIAENQDKVFEILNKQGIIDKNYNIL